MACKLPTGKFLHYQGLGGNSGMRWKIDYRVQELRIAIRMLKALLDPRGDHKSFEAVGGVHTELDTSMSIRVVGGSKAYTAMQHLRGRYDTGRISLAGHSFGASTSIAAGAQFTDVRCIVALDPYYPCIPVGESSAHTHASSHTVLTLF